MKGVLYAVIAIVWLTCFISLILNAYGYGNPSLSTSIARVALFVSFTFAKYDEKEQ